MGETQQNHFINYPYGHNPHPNPLPRRGKLYAFTLAEVLITLVIIGIIAAITVPSLINKTNNQETVSRLKKAYSTLSQATNQIIAEEGPVTAWSSQPNDSFILYKSKILHIKDCSKTKGCFTQGKIFTLNNTTQNWNNADWNKFVLQDGTQVMFSNIYDTTCSLPNDNSEGSQNYCWRLWVDLNGEKKPNTLGRDIFEFVVKKNGLYPAGCDIDNLCNKEHSGYACACKVLREGAINY